MPTFWVHLICLAASYLAGATPFAFLIAGLNGVDIRKVGSGNVGATNVFRAVGKGWGILTFFCDAAKGFVPAFLFPALAQKWVADAVPNTAGLAILCAVGAIAGHNWPVYLRFKGGKGVATSAGALLGIHWLPVTLGLAAWIVVFLITRYVSVGSITAAVVVAVCAWVFPPETGARLVPSAFTILAVLIIWRHKSNIQRLANGVEHRFEFRKKKGDCSGGQKIDHGLH